MLSRVEEAWDNGGVKSIVIDCRFSGTRSGLGRYTRNIVRSLVNFDTAHHYILVVRSAEESWLQDFSRQQVRIVECTAKPYSLHEQWRLPVLLRSLHADLLFSPHFTVPLLCPIPFVATVHDLILHQRNHDPLHRKSAYRLQMLSTVRRARAIITPSAFTRSELCREYGSNIDQKCSVVPEGVEQQFATVTPEMRKRVIAQCALPPEFLLYVGSGKKHKCVSLLLEARRIARTTLPLVLVTDDEGASCVDPDDKRFIVLRGVHDDVLPALYASARCFFTASTYEGYGLPIAEALTAGCPVVASRTTAIPETAQGCATFVEHTDDAFAHAMESLPSKPTQWKMPLWEDAARQTLGILERCIR